MLSAALAEICAKHEMPQGQLTLHSDRGAPMRSKPVALLLGMWRRKNVGRTRRTCVWNGAIRSAKGV